MPSPVSVVHVLLTHDVPKSKLPVDVPGQTAYRGETRVADCDGCDPKLTRVTDEFDL